MTRKRDTQRSRVYRWERTALKSGAPAWKTIDEVTAWARPIWASERGRYGLAKSAPPLFQPASWGQRSAIAYASHRITLPRWAREPDTVLHEMAHRLTPRDEAHGPRFVGVLIGLLARHAGYDAYALMAAADEVGVRYHARSIGAVPLVSLWRQVEHVIRDSGPLPEMWIAAELDVGYLQIRGAALQLIRRGRARWLRGRLTLIEATA